MGQHPAWSAPAKTAAKILDLRKVGQECAITQKQQLSRWTILITPSDGDKYANFRCRRVDLPGAFVRRHQPCRSGAMVRQLFQRRRELRLPDVPAMPSHCSRGRWILLAKSGRELSKLARKFLFPESSRRRCGRRLTIRFERLRHSSEHRHGFRPQFSHEAAAMHLDRDFAD